jgi:hypothetical protein
VCVGVALAAVVILLLFVIFFFAGGAPNAGLVAIWEDASAIGVKVCVFQDRAPTHVAGRWMDGIYTLMLQDAVTTTLLQR